MRPATTITVSPRKPTSTLPSLTLSSPATGERQPSRWPGTSAPAVATGVEPYRTRLTTEAQRTQREERNHHEPHTGVCYRSLFSLCSLCLCGEFLRTGRGARVQPRRAADPGGQLLPLPRAR